jgi:hypothetical protein
MNHLDRKIGQLRTKLRAYYAGHGIGRLAAFIGIFALGSFVCDYLFGLPWGMRALLLAGFFGGAGAVAWRELVRPLKAPMSDDDMVLFYESAHPDAGHRLISALQLRRQVDAPHYPFSRQLTQTVIQEADSFAAGLDSGRLVGTAQLKKRAALGGGLAAAVLILAVSTPELFSIWLQRFFLFETEWPRKTNLAVEFHDPQGGAWVPWNPAEPKSVVRGESARIRVMDTRRSSPARVLINYSTKGNLKSQIPIESNPAAPNEFEFAFDQVIDPIVFRPIGGDHKQTPEYTLEVRIPPRLNQVRVGYRLPRYTRTPASDEARRHETGNVETIPGSVVLFFGTANVPLREAWLETPGGRVDLRIDADAALSGEFRVTTPGEYRVRMVSAIGLENREESRFPIRIKPDRPPAVSIVRPARDLKALADSRIPVAIEIEDDYGIDRASMRAQVTRKAGATDPEVSTPVDLGETGAAIPRQAAAIHLFELAPLKLEEGDEVIYWAQASDLNDVAEQPGSGESNRFKFTVVSRATLEEEIYELGKEILTDLERLREHQIRTRSDTVELAERVRDDARFTDAHTKRLFQLALWQQHVRTSADEISKRLRKMIEDITTFQLAQLSLVEHLKAVDELARGIAEIKSPAAHQSMVQAPAQGSAPHELLERAGGRQEEIVQDLTRAIELMNEFSTISRVIRGVQGVIKTQKELRAEALEKHKVERKGKER